MDRSYQAKNARSRPLPEAKVPWASPGLGDHLRTRRDDLCFCSLSALDGMLEDASSFAASHPEGTILPWVPGSNSHVSIFAPFNRAARWV
jgi:hypothetical protein